MKMHFLRALFLLIASGGVSFAQNSPLALDGSSSESVSLAFQFQQQLQTQLDDLYVSFGDEEDRFGDDYLAINLLFLERLKGSIAKFSKGEAVQGIVDFLNWYESHKNDPDFQNTLKMKEKGLDALRAKFKDEASDLIVLNGFLSFPVSHFELLKFSDQDLDVTGRLLYQLRAFHPGKWPVEWRREQLEEDSKILFAGCETQECVFRIGRDYLHWIQRSSGLAFHVNLPVEGIASFGGPVLLNEKKIEYSLNTMLKLAYRGKE